MKGRSVLGLGVVTGGWVDPDAGIACCVLTDREFGDWAKDAWPRFGDAVLAAL